MKNVLFKTLSVKNFFSISEPELKIDFSKGINLITGENSDNGTRNGVGKSSLIEAVFWCLFGNTIRDIKADKIIHNHSKKTCEVQLSFDFQSSDKNLDEYKITRSLNPSKVQVLCNDKDITLSTIPANNTFIKDLIGASEELFTNAVIMTANNTMPFMAQKKIDKRKFLEGVFNLNIFTEMLLKARSDFNESKKEHDILCNSFLNEQKNLEIFEKQSKKYIEQKELKIKNYNDEIIKIKNDIDTIKNNIIDIIDLNEKINKNNEKIKELDVFLSKKDKSIEDLNNQNTEIRIKISQIQKDIENLSKKKETCPVCNRKYAIEEINLVEKKLLSLINDLQDLEKSQKNILSEIQTQKQKKTEIKNLIDQIREKNKNLESLKRSEELKEEKIKNLLSKIADYDKFIKDLQKEKDPSLEEIEKINKNIEDLNEKIKLSKKELSILENVKFVLSEEGVKTYIVKKLLDVLNKKLNFYLNKLDAPCTCTFNEQFEETITNLNGKDCSYFNFSGGERKRIDLAVLFMFQDILRFYSKTFFSLSIYDELFDSAIDEAGIEKVLDILRKKVDNQGEMVYIVSHNKSSLKNSFDNILRLEKTKGKTVLLS